MCKQVCSFLYVFFRQKLSCFREKYVRMSGNVVKLYKNKAFF